MSGIKTVQEFCVKFGYEYYGFEKRIPNILGFDSDKFISRMVKEAGNTHSLPEYILQQCGGNFCFFADAVGVSYDQLVLMYTDAPDSAGVDETNNHTLNTLRLYTTLREME